MPLQNEHLLFLLDFWLKVEEQTNKDGVVHIDLSEQPGYMKAYMPGISRLLHRGIKSEKEIISFLDFLNNQIKRICKNLIT